MTQVICIGSVLWDVIGRTPSHMPLGADVPGRISQIPGGVALNVAMTLRRFGMRPVLISAIGQDREGVSLEAACRDLDLITEHLYRSEDLPTDRYMAIEGGNGLIAAIADAHSLEAAGEKILAPLRNGALGSAEAPYPGLIALDGNLTETLLKRIIEDPAFAKADLRIAPASPGKAQRLAPFVGHSRGMLYVNLEEASLLCNTSFATAPEAARGLLAQGAARVLVTNGAETAADATTQDTIEACPPKVLVTRITGAGDTFMAAHMAREAEGADRQTALEQALNAAARYVAGETPS